MDCQTEIAKKIKEQKGDYVIDLKGNQGILHAEVINFFDQVADVEAYEAGYDYIKTIEKNHARIEEREIWITSVLDWLEGVDHWKGLNHNNT